MIAMQTCVAAKAIDAKLIGADVAFRGVTIDSRQVEQGQLFVALRGANHDGHDHVRQALDSGAAAALVDRQLDVEAPQMLCGDTLRDFGQLAAAWRAECQATVIGLTGSNGKTTTKGMLASILRERDTTLSTEGNFNNEIGVPLTLCRLSDQHRYAVIEMGAGQPGDIAYLARLAQPMIGLVTNAAPAHLERMGSIEMVAKTKGELFEALTCEGIAVVNADDDFAASWIERIGARQHISFGLSNPADVSGHYRPGHLQIQLPDSEFSVALKTTGSHNAVNALSAAAAAFAVGASAEQIRRGLEKFEPVDGRLQTRRMDAGWTLIADTYNANPASLRAGMEAALELAGDHWLVLGDMGELGPDADALHFQAGAEARRLGVTRLFALGDLARHAVAAFGEDASHFTDRQELIRALSSQLRAGTVLMVKGSRSMQMEKVCDALTAAEADVSGERN